MNLLDVAKVAAQAGEDTHAAGRAEDVVPVERIPAQRRHGVHDVAQPDGSTPRDPLHALEDELILGRGHGALHPSGYDPPLVPHERGGVGPVLADRPDPLVLHVQRRGHAANLEGGAAGDPAAEIAPPRGRRELASEQRVHGSGGSQHQQIEVFPQVGIMLACLRKQELDSVRHADPADLPHEGQGAPDPLSLPRDALREGRRRRAPLLREPLGNANQYAVVSGEGKQRIPIDPLDADTVAVQPQPQDEAGLRLLVRRGHRVPNLSITTRCKTAFASFRSPLASVTPERTQGKTVLYAYQRFWRYGTEYSPLRLNDSSGPMSRNTGTSGVGVIRCSTRIQNQFRPSDTSTSVS